MKIARLFLQAHIVFAYLFVRMPAWGNIGFPLNLFLYACSAGFAYFFLVGVFGRDETVREYIKIGYPWVSMMWWRDEDKRTNDDS